MPFTPQFVNYCGNRQQQLAPVATPPMNLFGMFMPPQGGVVPVIVCGRKQ